MAEDGEERHEAVSMCRKFGDVEVTFGSAVINTITSRGICTFTSTLLGFTLRDITVVLQLKMLVFHLFVFFGGLFTCLFVSIFMRS